MCSDPSILITFGAKVEFLSGGWGSDGERMDGSIFTRGLTLMLGLASPSSLLLLLILDSWGPSERNVLGLTVMMGRGFDSSQRWGWGYVFKLLVGLGLGLGMGGARRPEEIQERCMVGKLCHE